MKNAGGLLDQYLNPNNAPDIGTAGTGYGGYLDWLKNAAMGGFKSAGGVGGGSGMGGIAYMKKAGKLKNAPQRTAYQKDVAKGKYLDVGSNPYVQDRLRIMGDEHSRALDQARGSLMSGMANQGGTMGMSGMSALASQNIAERGQQQLLNQQSGYLSDQYQAERGLQQASDATAEQTRQTAIQSGAGVQAAKNTASGMVAQARANLGGARIQGMLGAASQLGKGFEYDVANKLLPAQMTMQYMNSLLPYEQYMSQHKGGWQGALTSGFGGFMAGAGAGGMIGGNVGGLFGGGGG
jgi:hypothetical protein